MAFADLDKELRCALVARLEFRRALLTTLVTNGDAEDWQSVRDATSYLKTSHDLGTPTEAAFSSKIQRRLSSSTPPRPMLVIAWDDAMKRFDHICADTIEANRLTSNDGVSPFSSSRDHARIDPSPARQSPTSLQRAAWAFAYRDPAPGCFARGVLQDRLFGEEGLVGYDMLLEDFRELVLAGDPLIDPESLQVSTVLQQFKIFGGLR